jgi:hypothetical protein
MEKIISNRLIFLSKRVDAYSSGGRGNLHTKLMKQKIDNQVRSEYANDYDDGPPPFVYRKMPKMDTK